MVNVLAKEREGPASIEQLSGCLSFDGAHVNTQMCLNLFHSSNSFYISITAFQLAPDLTTFIRGMAVGL